ncbi:MAG TPA: hypothetical protein VFH31_00785, partial [Pyrinomonadaceae bacterium]|nr:hypothetical protein [Pyrinomonadaceae bacterium]
MQYLSSFSPLRLVIFILITFALCLAPTQNTSAASLDNKKTRNRAEKAIREGEFEVAEKILRELLNKDSQDNIARLSLS